MKFRLALVFAMLISGLFAQQQELNAYKYIIVPKKYDFQKRENQYLINTYVSHALKQQGFTTVYEDEIPEDLYKNPCLGLKAKLQDLSGMLSTRVSLELVNCRNESVYISAEGKSKIKEYEASYREAIGRAILPLGAAGYQFQPELAMQMETGNGLKNNASERVETPQPPVVNPASVTAVAATWPEAGAVLYAQEVSGGFQLVDTTPKVVMVLVSTSRDGVFLVKDSNAMVYRNGDVWSLEYMEDGVVKSRDLQIKF